MKYASIDEAFWDQRLSLTEECYFLKTPGASYLLLTVIKLNDEENYHRISKVAAEIFLGISASPGARLRDIVEAIEKKMLPSQHAELRAKTAKLVHQLQEASLLQIV